LSPDPQITPPEPGFMRLWKKVVPDLQPGGYTVRLEQTLGATSGTVGEPQDVEVHFDITGPRFSLPGTEIHSVFPPPNAQGTFSSRLPHIALKRRTLPWERTDADHPDIPWLALVVLADFEAELRRNEPIRDAFTSDAVAAAIAAPDGTCDHIVVTQRVVDQTFPSRDELPLLSHVRQVSLRDAENLGSDADGWMAVLISNRLPQPNTTYGCYLISLEGQLEELPAPGDVQTGVGPRFVYEELAEAFHARVAETPVAPAGPGEGAAAAGEILDVVMDSIASHHQEARVRVEEDSGWLVTRQPDAPAPRAAELGIRAPGVFVVDFLDVSIWDSDARKLRFPVLAHWTFHTEGAADFQQLMENLDVGMLGKQPAEGEDVPILDTGHTVVERLTRRGESAQAWYRGPLTPRQVARRTDPPALFTAEQALRLGEDGRWDLSEAAAFEIGRLLALSDAAFIDQLARWRREGFTVARRRVTGEFDPRVKDALDHEMFAAARLLQLELIRKTAESTDLLGPVVAPVDHEPLLDLASGISTIAAGFNLNTAVVRAALAPGLSFNPATPDREAGGVVGSFDGIAERAAEELVGLKGHLDARVDDLRRSVEELGGELPDFGGRKR
jgi:hypothetical protein